MCRTSHILMWCTLHLNIYYVCPSYMCPPSYSSMRRPPLRVNSMCRITFAVVTGGPGTGVAVVW